jgi:hypothetical protein
MPNEGCPLKQVWLAWQVWLASLVWMAQHHHRPPWTPLAQVHHPIHL